jgi:hypothetical protein
MAEEATMNTTDTPVRVTLSSAITHDHLDRLYSTEDDIMHVHVDGETSGRITVIKSNKKVTTIELDRNALREMIDDLDYQIECVEDAPSFVKACKRAIGILRAVKS